MSTPNTIPLTWNGYVAQIANMAVVQTTIVSGVLQGVDVAFNTLLPQACNYAELRIQRDLDLLPLLTSGAYALTTGSNLLTISVNDFFTLQTLGIQSGTATTPLLPTSKEFLQNVYGDSSFTAQPVYFAMIGGDAATGGNVSNNILVGPYPDQNYPVVATGTIRMPSLYLSATTPLANTGTTFISTYLPDLMIQASMIYVTEYQRNFGATSNDPQMGVTYESAYENLLKGAIVESARQKFQSTGWASQSPALLATPTRG